MSTAAAAAAAVGLQLLTVRTGKLNQTELTRLLSHFLSSSPPKANSIQPVSTSLTTPLLSSTLTLHNRLVAAIYANCTRDAPPEPVAAWVLATDAPSASHGNAAKAAGAGAAGDKVEERNKREVMALSARDRRRIKAVGTESAASAAAAKGSRGEVLDGLNDYRSALSVQASDSTAAINALGTLSASTGAGANAGGSSKTNRDLEIRRRFALSLASESLEFPSRNDIRSRIEPIAYEEGLGGGSAAGSTLTSCAELVETAVEMFVKEVIASWLSATRSNGVGEGMGAVQTARFRRQLRKEEQAAEMGEIQRNAMAYLPIEAEAVAKAEPLAMDELRLVLRLDGGHLRLDPFLAHTILEEGYGGSSDDEDEIFKKAVNGNITNRSVLAKGINGTTTKGAPAAVALTNGVKRDPSHNHVDAMQIDEADWGWTGAGAADRDALMDVLGSTLAVSTL